MDRVGNARVYVIATAIFFAIGAAAHLVRLVVGFPIVVGTWNVAMWLSWPAVAGAVIVSAWGFRVAARLTDAPSNQTAPRR